MLVALFVCDICIEIFQAINQNFIIDKGNDRSETRQTCQEFESEFSYHAGLVVVLAANVLGIHDALDHIFVKRMIIVVHF